MSVSRVILLVADTVRRDYLGHNGGHVHTPNLDALAARSTVFDRHYAASFPTVPARGDMLTGIPNYIDVGWGPLPLDRTTIATLFGRAGFTTVGVVDTPFYQVHGFSYDRGFQYFYDVRRQPVGWPILTTQDTPRARLDYPAGDPSTGQLVPTPRVVEGDFAAPTTMTMAENCLEFIYEAPFFLLVDTWDPHEPWDPPAYFVSRYLPGYKGETVEAPYGNWREQGLTAEDLQIARATYSAKLEMVDRWIGRLLDKLEYVGIADDTAIVFTSDHGYYFGERDLFGKMVRAAPGALAWLRSGLYEEVAHVPLLVRHPGGQPGVSSVLSSALDVAPTLLDLAGVEIPAYMSGHSLVPAVVGKPFRGRETAVSLMPLANVGEQVAVVDDFTRTVVEWQPITVTSDEWSLLYATPTEPIELYHLVTDPTQQQNVAADHPQVVEQLLEALVRDHLKALGANERHVNARYGSAARRTP